MVGTSLTHAPINKDSETDPASEPPCSQSVSGEPDCPSANNPISDPITIVGSTIDPRGPSFTDSPGAGISEWETSDLMESEPEDGDDAGNEAGDEAPDGDECSMNETNASGSDGGGSSSSGSPGTPEPKPKPKPKPPKDKEPKPKPPKDKEPKPKPPKEKEPKPKPPKEKEPKPKPPKEKACEQTCETSESEDEVQEIGTRVVGTQVVKVTPVVYIDLTKDSMDEAMEEKKSYPPLKLNNGGPRLRSKISTKFFMPNCIDESILYPSAHFEEDIYFMEELHRVCVRTEDLQVPSCIQRIPYEEYRQMTEKQVLDIFRHQSILITNVNSKAVSFKEAVYSLKSIDEELVVIDQSIYEADKLLHEDDDEGSNDGKTFAQATSRHCLGTLRQVMESLNADNPKSLNVLDIRLDTTSLAPGLRWLRYSGDY
ncbi:hypothetical protein DXG01_009403 [Tephrocybe rancida]|nr:hypothetical protein DXG01_009403 [Tephrocybe rancida]